jgi:hypothetical protein
LIGRGALISSDFSSHPSERHAELPLKIHLQDKVTIIDLIFLIRYPTFQPNELSGISAVTFSKKKVKNLLSIGGLRR